MKNTRKTDRARGRGTPVFLNGLAPRGPAFALMKPPKWFIFLTVLVLLAFAMPGQRPPKEEPPRLPDGRLQTEEILKADYQQTLKDAAELLKLSEELKMELEKNDRHVLSIGMLKKTEEIEKIAKRIRSRLRRF